MDLFDLPASLTKTPHDSLFKAGFGAPRQAESLLRQLLPPLLVDAVDWSTLGVEPTEHINPKLDAGRSDLLFSAVIHSAQGDVPFYVLLEHQSTVKDDLPLRIVGYVQGIWDLHRREHQRVPLVIPIVVSHATGGWTGATCVHQLVTPSPGAVPGMDPRWVPNLEPLFYDLASATDALLQQWNMSASRRLIFWVLRDSRNVEQLFSALPRWADLIRQALMHDEETKIFTQVLWYLKVVLGDENFEKFRVLLSQLVPETEETMHTVFEYWEGRAREEGREEG
ncbi:MAG: Rpn family recombination-promoting nuclease/putative transposase, partial [Myxococcales bacterium]|nr:Rpn family recombination-promoting nuclease/putative transposase [Myxococcales bacterium]